MEEGIQVRRQQIGMQIGALARVLASMLYEVNGIYEYNMRVQSHCAVARAGRTATAVRRAGANQSALDGGRLRKCDRGTAMGRGSQQPAA